jgi:sugar lactone lactonase YvrE
MNILEQSMCITVPVVPASAFSLKHVVPAVDSREVHGVTSLNNHFFVLRKPSKQCIEVYDMETFEIQRRIEIADLGDLGEGLTSCANHKCLYVADWNTMTVFRIDEPANHGISRWQVYGNPIGLSVNRLSHVVVTCWHEESYTLNVFSKDGASLRTILLQPEVLYPIHAVETDDGRFVVSHGRRKSLNRVCIVDASGKVVESYGYTRGSAAGLLNGPRQLAVDINGFIAVADSGNKRIVIFTPSLQWSHDVFVFADGLLAKPYALHCCSSRDHLFVGDLSGRVLIFDLA